MKRVLITGANSYIGTNVERYLMEYNARNGRECYRVDILSLRDPSWENYDFAPYDTILHMAGKAHADIGHVSEGIKQQYYEINCDLAVRTAAKAKAQGVPQFVYMSSIIVYGDSAKVGEAKHITSNTQPSPANFYGDSKWQAEKKLQELGGQQIGADAEQMQTANQFGVAIVRSPMVYGKGSKGNFPLLVKLADKMPIFPNIRNERSMIYIDNLAEFLRLLIDSGQGGVFLPQNSEYVTTAEMVKAIGEVKGKKIHLVKALNPFVKLASKMPGKIGGLANKAFGSLTISRDCEMGKMAGNDTADIYPLTGYQIYDLQESICRSITD
uniref:NAD-dependent epimerase/dehydratase family protein n=1 Tax=Acetatifactor sp. TaxID=1872090 RepID=UPI00405605B2